MIFIPQFIYPLSNISLTASIYMTVAISLERYCAAHYPMDYRQVSIDKYFLGHILKYVPNYIHKSTLIKVSVP